jgi:hypothetical protein
MTPILVVFETDINYCVEKVMKNDDNFLFVLFLSFIFICVQLYFLAFDTFFTLIADNDRNLIRFSNKK